MAGDMGGGSCCWRENAAWGRKGIIGCPERRFRCVRARASRRGLEDRGVGGINGWVRGRKQHGWLTVLLILCVCVCVCVCVYNACAEVSVWEEFSKNARTRTSPTQMSWPSTPPRPCCDIRGETWSVCRPPPPLFNLKLTHTEMHTHSSYNTPVNPTTHNFPTA